MQRFRIKALTCCKICIYILFLNYYCFSVLRGKLVPYLSLLCYGASAFFLLADLMRAERGRITLSVEEKYWGIYAGLSLVSLPMAASYSTVITGLIDYAQRLYLIILITYISKKEKSVRFPLTLLTVICTAACASILPTLSSFTRRLKLASGYSMSANDIGSLLVYGCFSVLFLFRDNKKGYFTKTVITAGLIVLYCTVLFITGSRKAFYGIAMLFVMLLVTGIRRVRALNVRQVATFFIIAVALLAVALIVLVPNMYSTSLFSRLFGENAEAAVASDEGRLELIRTGIKDFARNPITGDGFACYDVKHGTYTHNTYVEALACSGIIGLFYLSPYLMILKKQWRLARHRTGIAAYDRWQKRLLIFFFVFLFLAVGIPYMYKDLPCVVLAMYIASQELSQKKLLKV